jgi:predicted transcriptional regulator of viral defense system
MNDHVSRAVEIFEEHHGVLRSAEAQTLGIHPQTIRRMVDRGLLLREEKGLYRLPDTPIDADPDLVSIAKLAPKAVFCLLTALNFHHMGREIPGKVYVALPFGSKMPAISHPPLDVVHLTEKPYAAGFEKHNLSGVDVSVYDEAKTVTDCFKFRKKVGENVALEALKEYLQRDNPDILLLLEYSEINRVKTRIEPFLSALL